MASSALKSNCAKKPKNKHKQFILVESTFPKEQEFFFFF